MKILFLAEYAPEFEMKNIEASRVKTVQYHNQIYDAIRSLGHDVVATSNIYHLIDNPTSYDIVWSLLRDGSRDIQMLVSALCNKLNIKYIGASSSVRALMLDKNISKLLAKHLEIPTPAWIVASKNYPEPKYQPFEGPYFVKPRFGGASVGISESSLAFSYSDVKKLTGQYFLSDIEVIIEEYIDGVEYGIPILNAQCGGLVVGIPIKAMSSKNGIITYGQKNGTEGGLTRELSDDECVNEIICEYAKKYFLASQPCDYARIDFMVSRNDSKPYFLETNSLMLLMQGGLTEKSLLNDNIKSYENIIKHIIDTAAKKKSF